jgi:hypothetical protein
VWLQTGFGLVNGFIEYLYTQHGTTSTYNATVELHTFHITTALAKQIRACSVFTSRSLTTASSNGNSSASRPQVLSSQPPMQNTAAYRTLYGAQLPVNTTKLTAPTDLIIISRHGPHRKHRSSIVAFKSVAAGTCLSSCCLKTAEAPIAENTVLLLLSACILRA